MYKIEKKHFGVKLTFDGYIEAPEMEQWHKESEKVLATQAPGFGVFVDMRDMKAIPAASQKIMEKGQKLYKQKGMVRSVVILNSIVTTMQFQRIAKETGIYQWERYINATDNPNWEKTALDWIVSGVDPDKK